MLLPCAPQLVLTAAAAGDITAVSDWEGLEQLAQEVNAGTSYAGKTIKLTADISLVSMWTVWVPIGSDASHPFQGTFDGQGHTVSGLSISSLSSDYQGLFGYVSDGAVKNLSVEGSVAGHDSVGGIVGYLNNSALLCCRGNVTVSGESYVGGLAGACITSTIQNCFNLGGVSGRANVGGIVGATFSGSEVYYCHNQGTVSTAATTTAYGAIIGTVNEVDVRSCRYLAGTCAYGMGGTESGVIETVEVIALNSSEFADAQPEDFIDWDFTRYWIRGTNYPILRFDPYAELSNHIKTVADLVMLRDAVNAQSPMVNNYETYYLDNDLDLSGISDWEPIGTWARVSDSSSTLVRFTKVFDGQKHKITGLRINHSDGYSYSGLFRANEGTIRNLGVVGSVTTGDLNAGGIVGYNRNGGTISNCYSNVEVRGASHNGGIAGINCGSIEYCHSFGNVSSSSHETVGGIAGENAWGSGTQGTISNSHYRSGAADGVVGYNDGTITGSDSLSRVQFLYQSNFANWNFTSIWQLGPDHPVFIGDGPAFTTVISNKEKLENLRNWVNEGRPYQGVTFTQTANISLNSEEWTPIGTSSAYPFGAVYDGGGYSVTGLSISGTGDYKGLFGYVQAEGTVSNLSVSGNVNGSNRIGGVVGYNCGTVSNCKSTVRVNGAYSDPGGDVGGIAGYNSGTVIRSSQETNKIDGRVNVGGIVGYNIGEVKICYNTSNVEASTFNVGGIVGSNYSTEAKVENCYNTGQVFGSDAVGGVVGINKGNITYCYNRGFLYPNDGGIVGDNKQDGVDGCVTSCYCLVYVADDIVQVDRGIIIDTRMLTLDEFEDQANFKDWDFDQTSIWTLSKSAQAPVFFDMKLTPTEYKETGYYYDSEDNYHEDATACIVNLSCGSVAAEETYIRWTVTDGENSQTTTSKLKTAISGGEAVIGLVALDIADIDLEFSAAVVIE